MDRPTAAQIESIMREVCERLNESIRLVKDSSTAIESQDYRRKIGKVMGDIFLEVQQPIYTAYPELTPVELRFPQDWSNS
jgi:hypothetical protein